MITEIELAFELCTFSRYVYLVFGVVMGFFLSIVVQLLIIEVVKKRFFKKEI